MNTKKRLFGDINMTWTKVIIFAIIIGVYTGIINQVPQLKDTSFRDIAISVEVWILFALIIVCNCNKVIEAGLKCGVFFMISQPIVYLVEIPTLGHFAWEYYRYWLIFSLLTFPGGMIAFYAKKQNLIGTLILSVANCALVVMGMDYLNKAFVTFPHHLLSAIYCFIIALVFLFVIQKGKKERITGFILIAVTAIVMGAYLFGNLGGFGSKSATYQLFVGNGEAGWSCVLEDESYGEVSVDDAGQIDLTMDKKGSTRVICTGPNGESVIYDVSLDSSGLIDCVPEE